MLFFLRKLLQINFYRLIRYYFRFMPSCFASFTSNFKFSRLLLSITNDAIKISCLNKFT